MPSLLGHYERANERQIMPSQILRRLYWKVHSDGEEGVPDMLSGDWELKTPEAW